MVLRLLAPRYWGIHALVVVLTGAAGWLGLWQLHSWQAHRDEQARDLSHSQPVPLTEVMGPDDPFPGALVGAPVTVTGRWLPEDTFFVSGRRLGDADGYWVLTPLVVDGGQAALPVVRGWTVEPDSVPAAPTGTAVFVGWLQPGEGTGAVDDDPADDVLPQVRLADILQRLDRDTFSGYVVLADREVPQNAEPVNAGNDGLRQASPDQLPPAPRFAAWRNLVYAAQWWIFGVFVVFVWIRYLGDELRGTTAAAAPAEEVASVS